jgi:hypothetical protein
MGESDSICIAAKPVLSIIRKERGRINIVLPQSPRDYKRSTSEPSRSLLAPGFDVALMWLWGGYWVPTAWLSTRFGVALMSHCCGFRVALGVFARPLKVRSSRFEVQSLVFTISIPNTTPLPRLPRGGLGEVWYEQEHFAGLWGPCP